MNDRTREQYLKHLNAILTVCSRTGTSDELEVRAHGIIARAKTAVEKITGPDSHYTRDILRIVEADYHPIRTVELILSVLDALRGDLEDGFIVALSELIRGDLFADYLHSAEHLLAEGYKDPAAVLAGSTLESHLSHLCTKANIDTTRVANGKVKPKSAAELNQELGKSVYSSLDQKQIAAWQDIRNNAAHGHFSAYSTDDVERFVEWLRDFIARHPA